jgi:hypothetical protein
MKLPQRRQVTAPGKSSRDDPRSRLVADVKAERYKLSCLIDEILVDGSVDDLDAVQAMLWGLTLLLHHRRHKE